MPTRLASVIINNRLQDQEIILEVDSIEWFTWLAEHKSFTFYGTNGHFTVRRESRRQKDFWYGYRRRDGKLRKLYLGKGEELTAERLERASLTLAGQDLFERYSADAAVNTQSDSPRIDTSFIPMTKVNLPVLPPRLITRPRLTSLIHTPITVVTAPSGFGKTTLLNDWARSRSFPIAWLSLDKDDNTILRFWRSIIASFQHIYPDFGQELSTALQNLASFHASDFVPQLTNQIVGSTLRTTSLGLVLDDFHLLTLPELIATIQEWLDHLPPNLVIVLSGSTRPPLALAQVRARGLLTELDTTSIRFTLEEGIHYLRQYPQSTQLADSDLETVVRRAEGWASGLTLAALALEKQENRRQFIESFSGAHIYLREYFLETVFQHLSESTQEFLLKTAVLKHLNGSLCDAVLSKTGSADVLSRLWQENMFVVRLEQPGWYRYNDLFAEMLVSQLKTRYPNEIPILHHRAAAWYKRESALADSIYHLLAIDAWDEAAEIIESMALRELEQFGEDSRLLRWLQELPEDVIQRHKTLLGMYLRLAYIALPKQAIERVIARIETNLTNKDHTRLTPDDLDVLAEIQDVRLSWAQGLLYPTTNSQTNETRWDLLNGLQILRLGHGMDFALLQDQLTHLLHQAQAQKNLFVLLMVGGVLARQIFVTGQLRKSEKLARQILEQALLQRGSLPETASITRVVLSHIQLERNELALANRTLAQAQEVDPNPTSTNMVVQFAILRAKILMAENNSHEAIATLTAIRDLHARRPSGMWTDADLSALHAQIYLRSGDITMAEQILSGLPDDSHGYLLDLAQAELLLQNNQAVRAEQMVRQVLETYPISTMYDPALYAHLLLVRAMLAQHKVSQALQQLLDAVRLATPERLLRPFLDTISDNMPLLKLALETERLTPDVQAFIREILILGGSNTITLPGDLAALTTSASITQREQDLLRYLSKGQTNRQIANQLSISESTVKTHLQNIFEKLGVNNRLQAVAQAKELKIIL